MYSMCVYAFVTIRNLTLVSNAQVLSGLWFDTLEGSSAYHLLFKEEVSMQDGRRDQRSMGSWVIQLCNLCARGYAGFDDLILLHNHITIDFDICYHLL